MLACASYYLEFLRSMRSLMKARVDLSFTISWTLSSPKCEAVAAFFGAVVNPKDAILRLEADGDFGQEFLADAQSCGGAGQGDYVGYGDHGGARLAGA